MSDTPHNTSGPAAWAAALPSDRIPSLIATAGRAPSVHNTQPWRFRACAGGLELSADRSRQLKAIDPDGRELVISCGAALFGLRLAIRQLGHLPVVQVLPEPGRPDLLARVGLGREVPPGAGEWGMLAAVPHRHTHRGQFTGEPLPSGLLPGMQHDALAEGATLVLLDRPACDRLRRLVEVAARWQRRDPMARAELRKWTRQAGSSARDGIPAHAFPAVAFPDDPVTMLAARDFDIGRGAGRLEPDTTPPAATAILMTSGDTPADWLQAGQALNRMLIHAAGHWVFAALNTQPMESPPVRELVRRRLALPGAPQMLLQLGRAHTARATARRPVEELML